MRMRTLDEHNKERHLVRSIFNDEKRPAGVKCDDCYVEMILENPNVVLASCPAQQTVICPQCKKLGYKVL